MSSDRSELPEGGQPQSPGILLERLQQENSSTSRSARHDPWRGFLLALVVLLLTWLTQRQVAQWTSSNPDLNLYLIQPIIWSGLALVAYRVYRSVPDAPPFQWILVGAGLLAGVFQVSVVMLSGVAAGYGDNPAAGLAANYPKNVLFFTTLIVGMEMSRAAVLHSIRQVNQLFAVAATTLVFAIAATPVAQWTVIDSADTVFQIGFGRYLPTLTASAVATAFAAIGGPWMSMGYRWLAVGSLWLLPILPAYGWSTRAFVGTAAPIFAYFVAGSLYRQVAPRAKGTSRPRSSRWRTWVLASMTAVVMLLFVNGVFGVRPYLVTGISMEPGFGRGDVVIIREVPADSLEVNDIIRFRLNGIDYVHRIASISEEDGDLVFITKGDNVSIPDPPVVADAISGKAVFLIPKVGLPSIWIRDVVDGS